MSDGQVDVPSSPPIPARQLPPIPDGHVALEVDWSYPLSDDEPPLDFLLDTQAQEWHVSLALVQEVGPNSSPVVRLSGPPANVLLALLRYNGAGQIFDVRTFKWVEQSSLTEALTMFFSVYDFTTGRPTSPVTAP